MHRWLLLGLVASPLAFAQEALTFSATRVVTHGEAAPTITFQPGVDGRLKATVVCGTARWSEVLTLKAGTPSPLALTGIAEGSHDCTVEVMLEAADGSSGSMGFDLQVASLPMLTMTATLDDLDLTANRLVVHATRAVAEARVTVIGARGAILGQGDADLSDPANPVFSWTDGGAEEVKLEVEARDANGFRSVLTLSPWQYAIPHEDVVFASGSAEIPAEEAAKLERSWAEIARTMELYGSVVTIRLFVAGYTDTVGPAASNQGLSERRARSIGRWFQQRGFPGEVSYQGFGEAVLAVKTGDETDEPANRRALYVLAAEVPPVSQELPALAWKRL